MSYSTYQAVIENNKVLFTDSNFVNDKKVNVLITVIEDEKEFDVDFRELEQSEVTPEILQAVNEAKKVPKHLLCNI